MSIRSLYFDGKKLELLDVRGLPERQVFQSFESVSTVAQAIRDMVIIGPTIVATAAAYALMMEAQRLCHSPFSSFYYAIEQAFLSLRSARPACKSLMTMLDRMHILYDQAVEQKKTPVELLEMFTISTEHFVKTTVEADAHLAKRGAELIKDGFSILTTGGTGLLSSVGVGSAMAIIREAARQGKSLEVYCTMSRPLQLGRRMSEPELASDNIANRVISDAGIAYVLNNYPISCVLIGANAVAANGDVIASAGSSMAAMVAKRLGINIYVAVQDTVVDLQCESGNKVPLEEIQYYLDPDEAPIMAPLFDSTPADCVTAYITKYGVFRPKDGALNQILQGLI